MSESKGHQPIYIVSCWKCRNPLRKNRDATTAHIQHGGCLLVYDVNLSLGIAVIFHGHMDSLTAVIILGNFNI